MRIIFHFKNQPDDTVKATIDTPATNGFGMPLDSVKQTGRSVEVGVNALLLILQFNGDGRPPAPFI